MFTGARLRVVTRGSSLPPGWRRGLLVIDAETLRVVDWSLTHGRPDLERVGPTRVLLD